MILNGLKDIMTEGDKTHNTHKTIQTSIEHLDNTSTHITHRPDIEHT